MTFRLPSLSRMDEVGPRLLGQPDTEFSRWGGGVIPMPWYTELATVVLGDGVHADLTKQAVGRSTKAAQERP